mmetsp:Transcript_15146/g.11009  ORF Transcript_15146/g.11009 Transcript_15146/m.11009 type:complete len:168 (+) Transcript_15146:116-619(+)|eukprot:CAMPEP_0202978570 /NCGR_PEP_ID=MMETSP1396-20130829/84946_1 /ASSEMBLY_ACC=CAM_ASM_000872 /TAXON_ID= /ORGANISM="Pseudokeronopsis sp., Strain Brazil" /LENGTH=167 /DNA_ID=CAMNT_0049717579 /DNA_START=493 /DNA_END=996 /DNA_ORIENTATION=+
MLLQERSTLADGTYMKSQADISESMRAILVDWLVDVHRKFKLLPETLFLTVNLLDRYLSKRKVNRAHLQLVGITALLVVTKYEEIYPPSIKDLEFICDSTYARNDIIQMEQSILVTLDFDMCQTSAFRFLERIGKVGQLDLVHFSLALYLLELALLDSKMNQFLPSE